MIYKKFMRAGGSAALIFSGFTFSLEAQNPTEEDKRSNVTQPVPATPAPAPDAIPDGAVDVQLKFTSNFLDRGEDRGRNRSVQRGKAYNSKEDP